MFRKGVLSGVDMSKGIDPRLISSRGMGSVLLPYVAEICCCFDYQSVCYIMDKHFNGIGDKQKLVEMMLVISDKWITGRLVEDAELFWTDKLITDLPAIRPIDEESEAKLPLGDVQVKWLKNWADERGKVKVKAKKAIPDHYSLELDDSELETLMSKLQEGCFISLNTVLDDFVYYLTGRGRDEPREPIIWTENKRALAFFVGNKFADTDGGNLWAIAEKVFVYKQKGGDRPKARSLAVDYSTMLAQGSYRYGGNSKVIKKLEAILKN